MSQAITVDEGRSSAGEPISALSAAKHLGQLSGWSLSNLALQKIIYLAHMIYLGRTGRPLVAGHFEAWELGPVHPDLYRRAKIFGSSPVQNIFHSVPDLSNGEARDILDEAFDVLGKTKPGQLVAITHWERGAWATHYVPNVHHVVIPNESILREYQERERGKG